MTKHDAIKHLSWNISFAKECDEKWASSVNIDALEIAVRAMAEERKKGFWEWVDDMDYRCSVCHTYAYGCLGEVLSGHYKYCPYCGARMSEKETDDAKIY